MKVDLTTLTKDQLIQALELYMADVDRIHAEYEKADNLAYEYEALYKRLNADYKKVVAQRNELEETVEILSHEYKKQKALAGAACMQAVRAKRTTNVHIDTVNVYNTPSRKPISKPKSKLSSFFSGTNDKLDIDTNGLYSPRK